jgi:ABC-type multidrug transport system ATPase subunit
VHLAYSLVIFRVDKLYKSYGDRPVLSEVDFELTTGEIMAVFGRNGSGKTTMFDCIGGLKKADIKLFWNRERIKPRELFNQKLMGYVPQNPFLPLHLRVRDLISVYLTDVKLQEELFYDPIIAEINGRFIGQLSQGQRKYLELCLVGQLQRPLLIMDEPFTMLEPKQIELAKLRIRSWTDGSAILISDHYYKHVWELSQKHMVIDQGYGEMVDSLDDLRSLGYLPSKQ